MTSATPLIILKFMSEFVKMIERQANQRVRILRLKDIKDRRQEIEDKIRERMEINPSGAEQCQ